LDWLKLIAPCFEERHIVDQSLVELRSINVIARLNEELLGWEQYQYPRKGSLRSYPGDIRPTKRNGIFLADDEHGLLITDMTPRGPDETVIEFKPKWLTQSPSAPENSKRCRQCARVAKDNAERARIGERLQKTVCPLDLVSSSNEDLVNVATLMLAPNRPNGPCSSETEILRFAKWLSRNPLLERLKNMQALWDQKGPLEADVEDQNFLVSMTLRDCTVFLRLPNDETKEIEARIGDLDLKSPGKKEYWQNTERALIEEGWYEGLEDEVDWQPLNCKINQERHTASEGRRRKTQ
jgi:inositol-pentakisphosphate 2-kinase